MATVKRYLESLPCCIREKALANLTNGSDENKVGSLREALTEAFTWSTTPEGDLFWQEIHDQLPL